MISTVLVANRGEIACRVFRTCRELGITTVAVYSDGDASALHVREADAAVRLPGSAPAETYLRGDLIVKAALAAGADAVHPGYGFLSENADFARAVEEAGLVWIGPPPGAIEAMASKTRAKELLGIAPLTDVGEADLPVLVKAAAGGGGRGMRIVRDLAALPGELAAASAEAASAFGDGEVFVEPYVENGRHVEVQILADGQGTVWALGTRDCSLQRRHQKVIEEAPAPGLPPALRAELGERSVAAAKAVGYVGAGTVEFLVADGRAHFLEMNTRLQVEHPVTEAVFGLDLVALQLSVAEGTPLPPEPPRPHGHAVEARLYAEDPSRSWSPQTGVLHTLEFPGDGVLRVSRGPRLHAGGAARGAPTAGAGSPPADDPRLHAGGAASLRVDTGYASGDTIGVHYDAMLAKVVAHAPTRAEAVRKLAHALARARIHGPVTNRDLLVASLRHEEFTRPESLDTGFYDRNLPDLVALLPGEAYAAVAAALAAAAANAGRFGGGWRNVRSQDQVRTYGEHEVRYRPTRDGGYTVTAPEGVRPVTVTPHHVRLEVDGVVRDFEVARHGDTAYVGPHRLTARPRFPDPRDQAAPGSLLAPMPGTVVRVAEGLAVGDPVTAGQPLLWLEAMKMEHRVTAPASGTLTALHAAPGRQVEVGALLAVVQAVPTDAQEDQK
ncbi:acety-l/propionyl-CoA carboxylase subunit alpha [Streptomyces sp. QHH-9511]|uniref:acetyl/propionyl/methylcrotonyl-CoA carboxylase subunit alpha n=1 Tax=Streptomyces sp. QHH-9511 TaxID=2684468 RepID=UPI0013171258|nr:biotin carboxylase N-terminal domain-containing protein [Streptomyces sp. QHH-9511]QGZ50265.1 acety-l/propionyl-CoA carboxylase subunit alpha [Streptomyces sp. QHH-9511]